MAITLDRLKITQGDFRLTADVTIKSNQTSAIIGPSGGGKSTLLMLIAGFFPADDGRISINGQDVTNSQPSDRPLSVLFQENNLFPHLTVFQNTALGINPNLKLSASEIDQANQALKRVGLDGRQKDLPSALSGGQRQRVALARALLRKQPVLLLDEPFAALGPALRHEMLDLVAEIRAAQNITLLLVTHNPEDALRIAAETIVVADGRVSAPQPTGVLLNDPPAALADYLGTSSKKGAE